MKIYSFEARYGRSITEYDSQHVILARIAHTKADLHIHSMYIGPQGLVGYHAASAPQLFLVVSGEGWVSAEGMKELRLTAGQAAYWEKGEMHESGSSSGMLAIILEAAAGRLDPSEFMWFLSG